MMGEGGLSMSFIARKGRCVVKYLKIYIHFIIMSG